MPAKKQPPKKRRRLLRFRRLVGISAIAFLLMLAIAPARNAASRVFGNVLLAVAVPLAPETADFDKLPHATRLVGNDGQVIGELGVDGFQRREPVELATLPDHVRRAVLAAEDKNFYEHGGVDPQAVTRAAFSTLRGNTQGGSTITQQLAKLNYTAGERTLFRKLRELLYASKLEREYTKDELLERYLNQVYFGDGAYGLESAARSYYGVSAGTLTTNQAAVLAGKIRAPEKLDPRDDMVAMTRRRNQVLVNMRRKQWLTVEQYNAAVAEPIVVLPKGAATSSSRAPHFVSYVEREAKTLDVLGATPETRAAQLYTGGYQIETTFDAKTYDATVTSVAGRLGNPEDPVTAVASVVPGDGAIRSLFGGLDFASTQFDMASLGGRQAGSAFKPFVYMAAARAGIDPRSTFNGASGQTFKCYGNRRVGNYSGESAGGAITVDDALVRSVNVVFVALGCEVGSAAVIKAATDSGIPADATTTQGAVFLGGLDGEGVNTLEMASAYATWAAEGVYAAPYSIKRIVDADGKVVYEHKPALRRAYLVRESALINGTLARVVTGGTGRAAAIGRPVAGKTGTTQDYVDAWFTGYTPDLATSVWVGYPTPKPMRSVHGRSVTGGSFPAEIFSDVMKVAHSGVDAHPLITRSAEGMGYRQLGT